MPKTDYRREVRQSKKKTKRTSKEPGMSDWLPCRRFGFHHCPQYGRTVCSAEYRKQWNKPFANRCLPWNCGSDRDQCGRRIGHANQGGSVGGQGTDITLKA